ncbi:MAG TPA: TonB-dependent receptor [Opitutaceae bacterium]|nr:TonB-dependent receptor [Opitutaceae bacterium]
MMKALTTSHTCGFAGLVRRLCALVFSLILPLAASAQVITTSTLSGVVVAPGDAPVAGATLTIRHEPTGTEATAVTRSDGRFAVSGLRPGGPYTVTATASGQPKAELREVYLDLERGADVNLRLPEAEVITLDAFVVSESAVGRLFDPSQTGSGSYLTRDEINNLPAGDRSINALARLDPRITYNRDPQDRAISVSGINNRYNRIQVDGVSASDPFGLNGNNTAAERNVIPLDSVEAISVNTAPYNTRSGGFVGAQINAVTKSGTNEFKGSTYFTYRARTLDLFGTDLQLVGIEQDGKKYPLAQFKERTYGVTLGGPIIPKKLFFYIAYEKVDEDRIPPSPTALPTGETIRAIAEKAVDLGFEPGSSTPPDANKLKDDNLLAKVDWQINDNHRASFRFNTVESSRPTFPGFGSGAGQNNFSFDSSWYKQDIKNTSYIAQLISRWTDALDTEISLSRSEYHSEPKNNSTQPYVEIRNVPVPNTTYTSYVSFGTEFSRHFNILDTTSDAAELFASYKLTDRQTLQFGVQYDTTDIFNAYVQYHYGYYVYNSLEDFLKAETGGTKLPSGNAYQYNAFIDGVDPAANFSEANFGVFVNDRWRVRNDLTLDLGVRLDSPILPDEVPFNQLFLDTFARRNDYTYDGDKIVQPRVGFNWQPELKRRTTLRGGVGLFYGRMPRVWMSNSYSNTGLNYASYYSTTTPPISADPNNQPTVGTAPAQTVAFVDDGFQLPSRWKSNIAFERELPFWDIKFTGEFEYSWVESDVFYENINIQQTSTGPDGRALYFQTPAAVLADSKGVMTYVKPGSTSVITSGANRTTVSPGTQLVSTKFTNRIMMLTNTDKGTSRVATFSFERPRKDDGWAWKAAYVRTDANEVLYGTSSVAASNWNNRSVFNVNAQDVHTAELEIRDRFLVSLTKDFALFGKNRTTISLLFDGHSGLPYSFTYTGDANGDGQSSNDLLYVPVRGDSSTVRFATAADQENFYKIVDRFGLTEGQVVEAVGQRYPWVNQYDLTIKQDIKLPAWRHKLVLAVDILNIGNLLNSKWGVIRGSNQFYVKRENVATVNYDAATRQYVYSKVSTSLAENGFNPTVAARGEPAASRWSVLFSARYEF